MAVFAVMIRIASGVDYPKRYADTVSIIEREAGGTTWDEPTSTYVFISTKSASDLCDAIYFDSPLYDSKDTLVVINLSAKGSGSYAQRGAEYPNTLSSLMDAR